MAFLKWLHWAHLMKMTAEFLVCNYKITALFLSVILLIKIIVCKYNVDTYAYHISNNSVSSDHHLIKHQKCFMCSYHFAEVGIFKKKKICTQGLRFNKINQFNWFCQGHAWVKLTFLFKGLCFLLMVSKGSRWWHFLLSPGLSRKNWGTASGITWSAVCLAMAEDRF